MMWTLRAVAALGLLVAAAAPPRLFAQGIGPEPAGVATAGEVAPSLAVEAATRAYLDRVPEADRERSDAYFEGGYWLGLGSFLWGLGVAWLLLSRRVSARLRDRVEARTRRPALQAVLYTALYVPLTALLTLPLTVYAGWFREHQYGLSNQTFGAWARDQLVGPVFIAPLFNEYTAVDDPEVAGPILRLARANGIPAERVYQFDASRQSRRISANVSGLGATMRISLNDNLLNRCSQSEIEAVMGHEMGHYALNHVYKGLLFFGVVIVVGLVFVRWGFDRIARCRGEAWGLRGIGDVAGLPLLVALLSVWMFVLTPLLNTWIRSAEAEADLFGINASRQPERFAEVALKLGEYRKLDPGPVEEWIFFDHPSGRARIEMAMRWRAGHPQ